MGLQLCHPTICPPKSQLPVGVTGILKHIIQLSRHLLKAGLHMPGHAGRAVHVSGQSRGVSRVCCRGCLCRSYARGAPNTAGTARLGHILTDTRECLA